MYFRFQDFQIVDKNTEIKRKLKRDTKILPHNRIPSFFGSIFLFFIVKINGIQQGKIKKNVSMTFLKRFYFISNVHVEAHWKHNKNANLQ